MFKYINKNGSLVRPQIFYNSGDITGVIRGSIPAEYILGLVEFHESREGSFPEV